MARRSGHPSSGSPPPGRPVTDPVQFPCTRDSPVSTRGPEGPPVVPLDSGRTRRGPPSSHVGVRRQRGWSRTHPQRLDVRPPTELGHRSSVTTTCAFSPFLPSRLDAGGPRSRLRTSADAPPPAGRTSYGQLESQLRTRDVVLAPSTNGFSRRRTGVTVGPLHQNPVSSTEFPLGPNLPGFPVKLPGTRQRTNSSPVTPPDPWTTSPTPGRTGARGTIRVLGE